MEYTNVIEIVLYRNKVIPKFDSYYILHLMLNMYITFKKISLKNYQMDFK